MQLCGVLCLSVDNCSPRRKLIPRLAAGTEVSWFARSALRTGVGTSSPWLMGQRPPLAGVAVAPLGCTALDLSGDAAACSAVCVRSNCVSHAAQSELDGQRILMTWTG